MRPETRNAFVLFACLTKIARSRLQHSEQWNHVMQAAGDQVLRHIGSFPLSVHGQ